MQKSSLFCISQDLRPSPQCSPFRFYCLSRGRPHAQGGRACQEGGLILHPSPLWRAAELLAVQSSWNKISQNLCTHEGVVGSSSSHLACSFSELSVSCSLGKFHRVKLRALCAARAWYLGAFKTCWRPVTG